MDAAHVDAAQVDAAPLLHEALYYGDLDEFLAGALTFVRDGLAAGEPVRVCVPEPRLTALREALAGEPVDFIDMAGVGDNPNRILPWVLRAFVDQHRPGRVRVLGEPVHAGRSPDEMALAVRHEALINLGLAGAPCHVLCPYDVARLPQATQDAERTHPVIVRRGRRRPSPHYTDPREVCWSLNRPLSERMVVDETIVVDIPGMSRVRTTVAAHATGAGVDPGRVSDLLVAVCEVCTNAVTHGGASLAILRMWSEADRVVYEVRSAGVIDDLLAGRVVPPRDQRHGRGLLIANQICDLVQTHSVPTGTTVRLHLRLSAT